MADRNEDKLGDMRSEFKISEQISEIVSGGPNITRTFVIAKECENTLCKSGASF